MNIDMVTSWFDICQYGHMHLTPDQYSAFAETFKALADAGRLQLFISIVERADAVCVCDLPDVGVSQPTVSHHLRKLRDAGLVTCERRGPWVHYWATDTGRALGAVLI